MKDHIGVDAHPEMSHSFTIMAAHEHGLRQSAHVLHGEDAFIFSDVRISRSRTNPTIRRGYS